MTYIFYPICNKFYFLAGVTHMRTKISSKERNSIQTLPPNLVHRVTLKHGLDGKTLGVTYQGILFPSTACEGK